MKRLDLGCGTRKRPGYIGVDRLALPGVDVVHDLSVQPYPFGESEIDEVVMDNVLEHLDDPIAVMEEVYRICRNGATVTVIVPYFRSSCAFIDPTHRHFFGVDWFAYFDPSHPFCSRYGYSRARFAVERREFDREYQTQRIGLLHRVCIRFAQKHPHFYEERLSHLYPLHSLTFRLRVIK